MAGCYALLLGTFIAACHAAFGDPEVLHKVLAVPECSHFQDQAFWWFCSLTSEKMSGFTPPYSHSSPCSYFLHH
eukprot:1153699-Pelagomonas_calceolata.AAC.1